MRTVTELSKARLETMVGEAMWLASLGREVVSGIPCLKDPRREVATFRMIALLAAIRVERERGSLNGLLRVVLHARDDGATAIEAVGWDQNTLAAFQRARHAVEEELWPNKR